MITRKKILQEIFSNFQQMTQWLDEPHFYCAAHDKAIQLIELLEIEDCGSVGGFDARNPVQHESGFGQFDRFLALIRKQNTRLDRECYFTVRTMTEFWKQAINLRETFNNG